MLYLCFIYILILRLHFSVGVRKCQVRRHSMENIALIFHMKKVAVEGKEKRIWMNRERKGQTKKQKPHRTIAMEIRILSQTRFQMMMDFLSPPKKMTELPSFWYKITMSRGSQHLLDNTLVGNLTHLENSVCLIPT